MKTVVLSLFLVIISASCETRSGIAINSMEKYVSSPEPTRSPSPPPTPIDAADVIVGDNKLDGEFIQLNGRAEPLSGKCKEFNQLMVNGDGNTVTITGACRQIMVNGDGNQITAEGMVSVVFNGTENVLRHSRYVNGKYPSVTQNKQGNTVEKISADTTSPQKKTK
jgi:hypothetical protein